jgi:hypothetical protein
MDQCNRIKGPGKKKNMHIWSNEFREGVKPIQWGKEQSFQQTVLDIHIQKNEI